MDTQPQMPPIGTHCGVVGPVKTAGSAGFDLLPLALSERFIPVSPHGEFAPSEFAPMSSS